MSCIAYVMSLRLGEILVHLAQRLISVVCMAGEADVGNQRGEQLQCGCAEESSRTPRAPPLSLMIQEATEQCPLPCSARNVRPSPSTLKPISGFLGSSTNTSLPAAPRCAQTIGATSFDGSSTISVPPHFNAVGIVTDVVLKPPEPAKTIPCEDPNEPSKHSNGDLPPAPQVSDAPARNAWFPTLSLSTR